MSKKVRIMIVDDDRSVRRVLTKGLGNAGYEVEALEDGIQALIKIDRSPPDVLISDINMPYLDGLKLAHGLRNHPIVKNLPIIFLTSSNTPRNLSQSITLKARHFLVKPVQLDLLLKKLDELTQRHS